mmetsp:Transcript_8920/g.21163  ORF Transcript_8920/g.21163 Transcript_8920/m.21163 type:complete len:247 (+) Transcript_8920:108-848(+)
MAPALENAADGGSIQIEDETGGFLDNIEYRGGGYAILRALWDAHEKGLALLSANEICARAKQWCSHHMASGLFAGCHRGLGWDAHGSLLKHGILKKQKLKARKQRDRIDVFCLTSEGSELVVKLIEMSADEEGPATQTPRRTRSLVRNQSQTPPKPERHPASAEEPPMKKPKVTEEAPAVPMIPLTTLCRSMARCFAALGSPIPKERLFKLMASEHDCTPAAFSQQLSRLEELNKLFLAEDEVHLV